MVDTPTFSVNQDGSVDLPIEGKNVRYVKEADLLAVKGGSDTKAREWENEKASFNTQLAEANRLRDESHQTLLTEQAAKEQLVKQYADYDTHKNRVGELETEIGSAKESIGKHETELTSRISASLLVHGASEEAIKEKTLDQLRNLEDAAKIFGNGKPTTPVPARYDGGPGPGDGSVPETQTERAHRIIDEAEARQGRPMQTSNSGIKS